MKILQINTVINTLSTGRIAEDIGCVLLENGHESYIAFGRGNQPSKSVKLKIGNKFRLYMHFFESALFDRQGFSSRKATRDLIRTIDKLNIDALVLHNLHGYYLHVEMLFDYIKKKNLPVIWTLYDCWAFTGHCCYFESVNCSKWKTQCYECPQKRTFPRSYFIDNSKMNFILKKRIFTGVKNLQLIVHSNWLASLVKQSFLSDYKIKVIHSGINLNTFKPLESVLKSKMNVDDKKIILGCAAIWDERKGLEDFIALSKIISSDYQIILVGLTEKQIKQSGDAIIGLGRTESVTQLAELYSLANVFVNTTYEDNFPTTNLEALACGTAVITYNSGGSPEAVDELTGLVVEKGDIPGLKSAIDEILSRGKEYYSQNCRQRAIRLFNKEDRYNDYIKVFKEVI